MVALKLLIIFLKFVSKQQFNNSSNKITYTELSDLVLGNHCPNTGFRHIKPSLIGWT